MVLIKVLDRETRDETACHKRNQCWNSDLPCVKASVAMGSLVMEEAPTYHLHD